MGVCESNYEEKYEAKRKRIIEKGFVRFTDSELKILLLIHSDLSKNLTDNKMMHMTSFFKLFHVPGVIGMRLYTFFNKSNNKGISFEDFIWGMSRIWRPEGDEFYKSIFQIYDVNRNNHFGVDELVTILRTYEKRGIYDQLQERFQMRFHPDNKIKSFDQINTEKLLTQPKSTRNPFLTRKNSSEEIDKCNGGMK